MISYSYSSPSSRSSRSSSFSSDNNFTKEISALKLINDEWYEWNQLVKLESKIVENLFIENHIDINKYNYDGDTCLHISSKNGWNELVKLLLNHNDINVNLGNKYTCRTPLMSGYCHHYNYHHINIIINNIITLLACDTQNIYVVESLLSKSSIKVNEQDINGNTALMIACRNGSTCCVELLLNNLDIDCNLTDNNGLTALHIACSEGHSAIVKMLIYQPYLDVNITDKDGKTAINLAIAKGRSACKLLLSSYPSIKRNKSESIFLLNDSL